MSFDQEEIDNLQKLLLSTDSSSIVLAVELMKVHGFVMDLLPEVLLAFRFAEKESASYKLLEALLLEHGSFTLRQVMYQNNNLTTESSIRYSIRSYTKGTEINGIRFAKSLFYRNGVGMGYLQRYLPKSQRASLYNFFLSGTSMNLSSRGLQGTPKEIFEYSQISHLDLSNNQLYSIPDEIGQLKNLRVLKLAHNSLAKISEQILQCQQLEELYLNNNSLHDFPEFICQLPNLRVLDLRATTQYSQELPESFKKLRKLELLRLADKGIGNVYTNYPYSTELVANKEQPLPSSRLALARLAYQQKKEGLAYLFANDSQLEDSPAWLDHYDPDRKMLNLEKTLFGQLPDLVARVEIEHLNLANSDLSATERLSNRQKNPKDQGQLIQETLKNLGKLRQLKSLDLRNNSLSKIPAVVFELKKLRKLDLRGNYIDKLSPKLACLSHLEELNFNFPSSKRMDFPEEFRHLKQLQIMQVTGVYEKRKQGKLQAALLEILPFCKLEFS